MFWFNSLYTRLAAGLILLLFVIGILYTALNTFVTQRHVAQLNQDLHRSLAQNLVADKNLVAQGELNETALKLTFQQYMVVNPSIEIYLLDLEGKLLSFSADPQAVMRSKVSLTPIKAFLSGEEKYPLGDDPRSHDKQKAFSVTEVPSSEAPEGYLYVVLRGERYDALESMAFSGFWARAGLWSMVLSLIVGLLGGLAIFYWLTRRLRRLSRQVETFSESDFSRWPAQKKKRQNKDEIGQIEQIFAQTAERIRSQLAALTDKDIQRRQLVAQVSHDLRTPLASMLGYVESLKLKQSTLTQREQAHFLDIVYTQGNRLSHMIDSLFQLSSLEAREVQPALEPFMPLEILFDIRQKQTIRAQQAGLTLDVAENQSDAFVLGDISLFERVLDNLIDNAVVHADKGSEISLHVVRTEGFAQISVQNRGKAIKEENLEVLFEPFFRAEGQSASKRHAGLGLAISKRIMQNLDGKISVQNIQDGVSFSIFLPLVE